MRSKKQILKLMRKKQEELELLQEEYDNLFHVRAFEGFEVDEEVKEQLKDTHIIATRIIPSQLMTQYVGTGVFKVEKKNMTIAEFDTKIRSLDGIESFLK